jgi:hypothetical protein
MSTPSDLPPPAPKSPLSSPSPLGSPQSFDAAPKPSFKVTRSPFAPKISGQSSASALAEEGPTPPKPSLTRKASSNRGGGGDDASPVLVLVDFVCAAVAIAAAVMIWLHTR